LQSFDKITEQVRELNRIEIGSIYDSLLPQDPAAAAALLSQTPKGLQDTIDKIKAVGAVNGERFNAEKAELEATNNLRRERNREIEKELAIINRVIGATEGVKKASDEINDASLINKIKTLFSVDNTAEKEQARQNASVAVAASDLPKRVKDELTVALKKAAEEGAQIEDVLGAVIEKYRAARFSLRQELTTNIKEQTNAEVEFRNRLNEELRVLDLSLKSDLLQSEAQYQRERLALQEPTTENILQAFKVERDERIKQLDVELVELRKKYELDANGKIKAITGANGQIIDIERDFSNKRAQINKEILQRETEAIRQFNLTQLADQERINQLLLQQQLQGANQRIQALIGEDLQQRIDLRNEALQTETDILLAANSKQLSDEVQRLNKLQDERRKKGLEQTVDFENTQKTISDLEKSAADQQLIILQQQQQKRVAIIRQGYADVISVISEQSAKIAQQTALGNSQELLGISEGNGGLFGRGFQQRIQGLRNRQNISQDTIGDSTTKLEEARQTLRAAQAELAANPSAIAKQAVTNAETEVLRLQTVITNAQTEINNSTNQIASEFVNQYADAFKSILSIAEEGYSQLNEQRQLDLDREISAREQRIDAAVELAKLGNTQLLDEEQKRLRAAQAERRRIALQEQAVNSALQLSYSLLAVAKAAAEGGGVGSIATVAAALGAIFSGYALVRTSQRQQETTGFADGGYTGDGGKYQPAGTVHKGEFVFDKETTARYRPVFEQIHATGQLPIVTTDNQSVSRNEFNELKRSMDGVKEAIMAQRVSVKQSVNERGVSQIVERQTLKDKLLWK